MKKILQFIIIVSMGLFMNSCYYDTYPEYEDNNGGGEETVVSYATDIAPLWSQCTGCHSGANNPNLNTNSYANLLNGYVVAGNADGSTLYKALTATGGVPLMPPGSAWPQAKINLVKNWINQGALNN